ncbi:hypothetical protein Sjap_007446 [Stephania japonica]|uniref:Fanconi anemia group I protein n=1 Tax=Stephania japonica TaxID=461633 RepID=A0AAP0PAF3_9MAGN
MATATASSEYSTSPPPALSDDDIVRVGQEQARGNPGLPPAFLLHPSSHPTILSHLLTRSSSSPALAEYVASLISLIAPSLPSSPPLQSLLAALLLRYLRLFHARKIPRDHRSSATLHLFSARLHSLPRDTLIQIANFILSGIGRIADPLDAQPLDLVPRLLDLIGSAGDHDHDHDHHDGGFVGGLLDALLECEWPKVLLPKMVGLLRELCFGGERGRGSEFLNKVFHGMEGADLQDLPSLVYQLLLLASKGFGRRDVVEGIVRFFGGAKLRGSKVSSMIGRQVEGTVLLHVNFAVKQDPFLAQEFMGVARLDHRAFNHFLVSVLLSVARVRRFSESPIAVLKSAVLTSYQDYKLARDCKWLPDPLKEECLQTLKRVQKAVITSIKESNYGGEHIVPSMVQFGLVLLESVEGENYEKVGNFDGLMDIEELGVHILKSVFDVHDMARNEIIEQCKAHILCLKPQQNQVIIKLLGCLVRSYPYLMLEHVARLKELLDYFTYMHFKTASSLVTALLPLIKLNRDLQDYTILVLRKALFRREDTVRLAATNAIINLILVEKVSKKNGINPFQDSSSQASSSQQVELSCGFGAGCCGQARVKEVVYNGLIKFVVLDPLCFPSVFDLLLPHFRLFYKEDESAPLNLNCCFKKECGKFSIEEPLDCFLSCISWILRLHPHDKSDRPSDDSQACFGFSLTPDNEQLGRFASGDTFANALPKIRKLMRNDKLEDILLQCQDSRDQSMEPEKRSYSASVLSGIVEVILNIVATDYEKAQDARKNDLEGSFLNKVDLNSKECRPTGSSRFYQTVIPFLASSSIHQLFLLAMKLLSSSPSVNKGSQNLSQSSVEKAFSNSSKLIRFTLKASLNQIVTFPNMANDDPLNPLIYGDLKSLGLPLFKTLCLLKSVAKLEMEQKKKASKGGKVGKEKGELILSSLICLKELISLSLHSLDLSGLIKNLISTPSFELNLGDEMNGEANGDEDYCELAPGVADEHTKNLLIFLEKRLKPLLSALLDLALYREAEVLSQIILLIGRKLPSHLRNSFGAWSSHLCRNTIIEDPKAAKGVIELSIHLTSSPNDLMVGRDIASELLKVVGSEETESVEKSETFTIINRSTGNAITNMFLQMMESVFTEIGWAITKLKSVCSSHGSSGEPSPGMILEDALYSRAEAVVNFLSFFAHMNLKEPQAEQFLRLTARFYKHLSLMTKLRIAPKGFRQALPGLRFEKLAEMTCKRLTAPLYNFVALMQRNQQENVQRKGIINKIKRENRCIPDLVFQIEDYEKYLIQLSKLTKVNLLRHAKRSTARDFKILDANKINQNEEQAERESSPVNSAASHDESSENSEAEGGNESEKVVSPESGDAAGNAVSGSDDEKNVNLRSKRAKMSKVVQDSDEET